MPPASMDIATQARSYRLAAQAGSYNVSGMPAALKINRATWTVERDAMLKRLDAVEALLRRLLPVVEKTKRKSTARKRKSKRGEIGDNNPPEAIDAPPLDVAQIAISIDAIVVLRAELKSTAPQWNIIRICGFVVKWLAGRVDLFLKGIIPAAGVLSAPTVFPKLQPLLIEITDKIGHWLHTLEMLF